MSNLAIIINYFKNIFTNNISKKYNKYVIIYYKIFFKSL